MKYSEMNEKEREVYNQGYNDAIADHELNEDGEDCYCDTHRIMVEDRD